MSNNFTLLHVLSTNCNGFNAALYTETRNEVEIPTTTAGGLWGAYLMTFAHFAKNKLAKN